MMTLATSHRKLYSRESIGDSMTRSRKMSGKMTTKQLQQRLDTIETEFHGFGNAAATELMKHNQLIYGLLSDLGKLETIKCENCGEEISRPILKGIENTDECPSCGKSLFAVTLDDFGGEEE